jgi:drug/metabolite transporter (DMT)-like permease
VTFVVGTGTSSVLAVIGCLLCLAAVVVLVFAIVLWRRAGSRQPTAAPTPPADPTLAADDDHESA